MIGPKSQVQNPKSDGETIQLWTLNFGLWTKRSRSLHQHGAALPAADAKGGKAAV
jgi:hypothetical protein